MTKTRVREYDRHHRLPQSLQGSDRYSNISIVPIKHHQAYHMLFGVGEINNVANILNKVWVDPHYKLFVVRSTKISKLPESKLKWSCT